ncbi:hypothetical protein ABVT39_003866 [Epinephelus coioides]
MISIYLIVTALVPTALTKGPMECHLSKSTAVQLCVGACGEPVTFHLPSNASKIILKRDKNYTILNISYNKFVAQDEEYFSHSVIVNDTILKMDKAKKKHSGHYLLEMFSGSKLMYKVNILLEVQAPVSKPAVSQMCLSPDQMKVSCSFEGDGVEIILTLDSVLLLQTRDEKVVSNVSISLHGQLTGILMCKALNNVSNEVTVIHLTSCKDPISCFLVVTVAVTASITTLLLALLLGIKHCHQKRSTTDNTVVMSSDEIDIKPDNSEDEVIYSDVRVKNTRKTRSN